MKHIANVLIVGRRSACYRAALRLGHSVFLWSSVPLHQSRRARLADWVEHPFEYCSDGIPPHVIETARGWKLDFVVAATESSVMLAAMLRGHLGLAGTTLEVAELAHHKFTMKNRAREHAIPITNYHLIMPGDSPAQLISQLGLPMVVKPVDESGATDVHVLRDVEEVEKLAKPGRLAETFVTGTEVSVETFVSDGKPLFHNITDYLHQWQKSIAPANLNPSLNEEILAINDQVIEAFGITQGMTHAEFYLTESGPVLGEIAVRPPGGYYMELIEKAYGFDTWETYVAIETSMPLDALPQRADCFAAIYIIHPEEGKVIQISGDKKIKKMPGVFEFELDLVVGETVADHVNTSNECGHVLLSADSKESILSMIEEIETQLQIVVLPH